MPKGPKGQKRPADVIGNAVKVMKIATGEDEEEYTEDGKNKAAVELGRKGGKARAAKMSANQRKKIAKKGAQVRWEKFRATERRKDDDEEQPRSKQGRAKIPSPDV